MYRHLLVPLDGSRLASKALGHAFPLAKALGARVTLFHASPEYPVGVAGDGVVYAPFTRAEYVDLRKKEAAHIFAAASRKATGLGLAVGTAHVIAAAPWQAILATARKQKCDAIVMSSHGRGGVASLLLGSETQHVLAHSHLPVLVVR